MKNPLRFALLLAVLPTLALAVYAPIPEQEQGKALTFRLGASAYHDSNIFGAPEANPLSVPPTAGPISSMVYSFTAGISFNGSIDDQTFASASYDLTNDYVVDRPTNKNLTSHTLSARLAHSFTSATNLDLTALYNIAKNPQSLLVGFPERTDQSFKRGQFDGRFTTAAGEKTGVVAKYRFINFAYDDSSLADQLDRTEHLFGLELSHALLPETKLVGEYRYQVIRYDVDPAATPKDKDSNYLMAGVDYNPGKNTLLSARAGFEARKRERASSTTSPYLELSARYTYAEGSFLAVGYNYNLEESSDVIRFTDSKMNRFFANVQHRLTGTLTASGSLTYESAQLQARPGYFDVDEKTVRFGLGLSWQPTKNWTVAGTYDLDDVSSDDPAREQNRSRLGVNARYTF